MNVSPDRSPTRGSVPLTKGNLPLPPNSSPSLSDALPIKLEEPIFPKKIAMDLQVKVRRATPPATPPPVTAPAPAPSPPNLMETSQSPSPALLAPPTHLRGDYYMRAKEELDDLAELRMEIEERAGADISDKEREIGSIPDRGAFRGCFEQHIRWMSKVRELYPFIEINWPGARTLPSVPVLQRPYVPYNDQGIFWNIQRVEKTLMINLRNLTIPDPCDVISADQSTIFSVLAPTNHLHTLIFPGILWPNCFGPLAITSNSARTIGDRLNQIIVSRSKVITFLEQVRTTLAGTYSNDLKSPVLTLFTARGRRLLPFRVNRASFFRVIHPGFNPLVTEEEASYLRGVCYLLHKFNSDNMASSVDCLLRTPQMDKFLCRELLATGCLDDPHMGDTAIKVLECYERLAQGTEEEN